MKETAVEWLHEEYMRILKDNDISVLQAFEILDKYKQAREMEKRRVINDYDAGHDNGTIEQDITGEQYYKETYEK